MKQNITTKQLNELSEKGKKKLKKWWVKNIKEHDLYVDISQPEEGVYCISCCENEVEDKNELPLLSTGQMVEFLEKHTKHQFHIFRRTADWKIIYNDLHYGKILGQELIDSLWEAVKEILEK